MTTVWRTDCEESIVKQGEHLGAIVIFQMATNNGLGSGSRGVG